MFFVDDWEDLDLDAAAWCAMRPKDQGRSLHDQLVRPTEHLVDDGLHPGMVDDGFHSA